MYLKVIELPNFILGNSSSSHTGQKPLIQRADETCLKDLWSVKAALSIWMKANYIKSSVEGTRSCFLIVSLIASGLAF